MNKDAQNELNKMLSLMERMEKHLTLAEAMDEKRVEYDRTTYTDITNFLNSVEFGHSLVGVLYIQAYKASKIYPTNPKNSQASNIQAALGKLDKSSRLYPKLSGLVNGGEFTNPVGNKPTIGINKGFNSISNNPFAGILKVTGYVLPWGGDANDFLNFEKEHYKRRDDMITNRLTTASWSSNPIYSRLVAPQAAKDEKKPGYHQVTDPKNSFFGFSNAKRDPLTGKWTYTPIMDTLPDGTQKQKMVLKKALKNVNKQWADYYLIDLNGEIDAVDKIVGPSMGETPDKFTDLRPYIDFNQMGIDEVNFIHDFSQEEENFAKGVKAWLLDHIAYIVGKDKKTGEYVRYINPQVEITEFNLNKQEFQDILDTEINSTAKAVRYVSDTGVAEE